MLLFTQEQYAQLLNNGSSVNRGNDHEPVVKLILPGSKCTWLLTEIDPEESDLAFGLCDLGLGFPELGYVSLTELNTVRSKIGLHGEHDQFFRAIFRISVYTRVARLHQQIVDDESILIDLV